jgi:hypothetical protein
MWWHVTSVGILSELHNQEAIQENLFSKFTALMQFHIMFNHEGRTSQTA